MGGVGDVADIISRGTDSRSCTDPLVLLFAIKPTTNVVGIVTLLCYSLNDLTLWDSLLLKQAYGHSDLNILAGIPLHIQPRHSKNPLNLLSSRTTAHNTFEKVS